MDAQAAVTKLLEASDLPRRFDEAREHPLFADAMKREPPQMPIWGMVVLMILVVPCMLAVWLLPFVTGDVVASALFALVFDIGLGVALWFSSKELRAKRHGRVRRVLHAVLDKSVWNLGQISLYKLVLWNPQIQPVEVTVSHDVYSRCSVGELGVALFRDKHLMELVRIPVSLRMSAA